MYEAGCQVPCTGANCGPGQSHQYFNTQPGALDNCKPPGFTCEAGELTGGGAAALFASKQAGNLTAKLASEEGCCSFDGCKTCADWCTQQGKDVCLAPQGAPGGGCDNSHSDPHAAPPQWCEAGAGGLTTTAPAPPSASTQADNLTAKLASEEGCCSFDGCTTCADWCTQQGKDVCLAPQGAPGGGCDNSHSDPHAAPPQWCEAGAGELSANGAPVSEDVKLASGDSCSQFCCWWGSDCGSCGEKGKYDPFVRVDGRRRGQRGRDGAGERAVGASPGAAPADAAAEGVVRCCSVATAVAHGACSYGFCPWNG